MRASLFDPLSPYEQVRQDYASYGLSVRGHPMEFLRKRVALRQRTLAQTTSARVKRLNRGSLASITGLVIVRQRPPTAKGTCFATLEDEDGFLDLILHKAVFERYEAVFLGNSFLIVTGIVQKEGHAASLLVKKLEALWPASSEEEEVQVRRGKFFS